MNTLKEQLKHWEKSNATKTTDSGHVSDAGNRVVQQELERLAGTAKPHEKVAGGDVLWRPIDKSAALMFARANWLTRPCHEWRVPENHRTNLPMKPQDQKSNTRLDININEVVLEVVKHLENCSGKELLPVAAALKEATHDVADAILDLNRTMRDGDLDTGKYLEALRGTRMAVLAEVSKILSQLKDLRQFFLSQNHETEIMRLKEFVDLCERLQKLKDSGFLDRVADTMIRLDTKCPSEQPSTSTADNASYWVD